MEREIPNGNSTKSANSAAKSTANANINATANSQFGIT